MGASVNTFALRFSISKRDDEQRRVFGVAMTATDSAGNEIADHQGDVISEADLEEAAYDYVNTSREGGVMHEQGGTAHLIESYVVTKAKREAHGMPPGPSEWRVGYQITDDATWDRVKSGELAEFSIEGDAVRQPIPEAA